MKKKSIYRSDAGQDIKKAIRGLFYISETDSAFEYFDAEDTNGMTEAIKNLLDKETENLQEVEISEFFGRLTADKEWHSEIDKNYVKKYRRLEKVFSEKLADSRVFVSGNIHKQIFIIGRTETGKLVGVKVRSLET